MLNVKNLNIPGAGSDAARAADIANDGDDDRSVPPPLTPGSTTAKALREVWSGRPVTIVDSPPGAGKTQLLVDVVAHLVVEAGLSVTVATPTRMQAATVATRLGDAMPDGTVLLAMKNPPANLAGNVMASASAASSVRATAHVTVRTVASCRFGPPEDELLIVDEAYQTTFADMAEASARTRQLLLVGDPGQIGPVVTADTTVWDGHPAGPHRRAPEVLAQQPDAHKLHLAHTYRLGAPTVAALAGLYDFTFGSLRADRLLGGRAEIAPVAVPDVDTPHDHRVIAAAVEQAEALVGATLHTEDGGTLPLEPSDVAVVASHNVQVEAVRSRLNGRAEQVAVGTADKLQGGQWHAVVAVDPLCGYTDTGMSDHALSLGRLCVMASRHATHLTWIHDGNWHRLLAAQPRGEAKAGLAVRRQLTAADAAHTRAA